jgi:hypothetical protein
VASQALGRVVGGSAGVGDHSSPRSAISSFARHARYHGADRFRPIKSNPTGQPVARQAAVGSSPRFTSTSSPPNSSRPARPGPQQSRSVRSAGTATARAPALPVPPRARLDPLGARAASDVGAKPKPTAARSPPDPAAGASDQRAASPVSRPACSPVRRRSFRA